MNPVRVRISATCAWCYQRFSALLAEEKILKCPRCKEKLGVELYFNHGLSSVETFRFEEEK